ncbi:hypothetical protein PG996_014743 [Apiospora saccharicola]|uniref:Uncharacterized protein n=1 Tax=Apiospora saccharicola TaxID=335842 RepID=A0ABR1TJ64_9PEZI
MPNTPPQAEQVDLHHKIQMSDETLVGHLMSENATLKHQNQQLAKENGVLQQSEAESETRLLEVLKAQLEVRTKELEQAELASSAEIDTGQPRGDDEGQDLLEARLDANRKIQEAISKVCSDVQRLLDSNQKLKAQKAVLENKISRMQQEKPKVTFEIDDLTIMSKWAQLDDDIVQISSKYLRAEFQMESFYLDQQTLYYSTFASRSQRDYVENRNLAPFFFRAVIWRLVAEVVLLDSFTAFSNEARVVVDAVRNKLASTDVHHSEMQNYLSWRAETAILLGSSSSRVDKRMWRYAWKRADEMASRLPQKHLTTSDRASFRTQLANICHGALDIASIFARSRAIFRIMVSPPLHRVGGQGPPLTVRFSEGDMEMVNQRREDEMEMVELTVRPGLVKVGDAEGKNYDQVITLVKAGVCC